MAAYTITRRTYLYAYITLLVLTVLTTAVAFVDLGVFNTVVAIIIAAMKAVVIVLFFMHLINSPNLVRVIASCALVWFFIMISLTMGDYITRGWLPLPGK